MYSPGLIHSIYNKLDATAAALLRDEASLREGAHLTARRSGKLVALSAAMSTTYEKKIESI
jgi:hypothetical protein